MEKIDTEGVNSKDDGGRYVGKERRRREIEGGKERQRGVERGRGEGRKERGRKEGRREEGFCK